MSYLQTHYRGHKKTKGYPKALVQYLEEQFVLRELSDLPSVRWVLDHGCGQGDFAKAWQDIGYTVQTVDREGGYAQFKVNFETHALPMPSDRYSIVFSKSVIEHIQDPSLMLKEIRRVLREDGVLVLLAPDWRTYMPIFYDDYTHVRPYDVKSLPDLLEANGFLVRSTTLIYQYPPIWQRPWLSCVAAAWRRLVPLDVSLRLTEKTGIGFFKWASLLTVLVVAQKA